MKTLVYLALLFLGVFFGCQPATEEQESEKAFKQQEPTAFEKFLIRKDELNLRFSYSNPERKISFHNYKGSYTEWRTEVFQKFSGLISYAPPGDRPVRELRSMVHEGITYHALVMEAGSQLSIPAYLLVPGEKTKGNVMAVHGHGDVEAMIGLRDDYHHRFAYELAREGYMVLCPELRGFSNLGNLSDDTELDDLDYWVSDGYQFTLVTEGFQHGRTLIGETIADLVAWENWWAGAYQVESFDVAGISYGGDLVLYFPVFSKRVDKIFCSGSLGSFNGIFATSYNAPAHCIPDILTWMDRSDIAGLNAPRPILLHYGELDTPSAENHSASYNKTVEPAFRELKEIYARAGAGDKVLLRVTRGFHHEMDNELLISFLAGRIK